MQNVEDYNNAVYNCDVDTLACLLKENSVYCDIDINKLKSIAKDICIASSETGGKILFNDNARKGEDRYIRFVTKNGCKGFPGCFMFSLNISGDPWDAYYYPEGISCCRSYALLNGSLKFIDIDSAANDVLVCNECKKRVKSIDDIYPVGFAGKCCKDCLPEAKRKYEYRGWAD